MVMKAGQGCIVGRKESREPPSRHRDVRENQVEPRASEQESTRPMTERADERVNPDELVMVMMPRHTWDAFRMLAEKNDGSTAQAMSTALKLLEKALEEVEKR